MVELNWKQWRFALIVALIGAAIVFLNTITSFVHPPGTWELFRLSIVPSLLFFFTTMLQKCGVTPPPPPVNPLLKGGK